jgi:hypothetical protein
MSAKGTTTMRTITTTCFGWFCCAWAGIAHAADLGMVNESAREIPVAHTVDVVVVGGSTGAVSAAVAAAKAGAKVFLAAPRPYLGDDMTATLRLWLEQGENPTSPLAQALFNDAHDPDTMPDPRSLTFRYVADKPAGARHLDTAPPGRLCDHVWKNATSDSLQFDDSVNIIVDLGKVQDVDTVRLRAFQSRGKSSYRVGSLSVSTSNDKKTWNPPAPSKTRPNPKRRPSA